MKWFILSLFSAYAFDGLKMRKVDIPYPGILLPDLIINVYWDATAAFLRWYNNFSVPVDVYFTGDKVGSNIAVNFSSPYCSHACMTTRLATPVSILQSSNNETLLNFNFSTRIMNFQGRFWTLWNSASSEEDDRLRFSCRFVSKNGTEDLLLAPFIGGLNQQAYRVPNFTAVVGNMYDVQLRWDETGLWENATVVPSTVTVTIDASYTLPLVLPPGKSTIVARDIIYVNGRFGEKTSYSCSFLPLIQNISYSARTLPRSRSSLICVVPDELKTLPSGSPILVDVVAWLTTEKTVVGGPIVINYGDAADNPETPTFWWAAAGVAAGLGVVAAAVWYFCRYRKRGSYEKF